VAFDRLGGPLVEYLLDVRARGARLQAQRVAAEVGLLALAMARQQEFAAQAGQDVGRVQGAGVRI
jgi:hypothetical protein